MRSSLVLVAAAIAVSGCGSGVGRDNCVERDDTLSAPTCRAEQKLSVSEPIAGLGFLYLYSGRDLPGTITDVQDDTLYIGTAYGPFVFRWHGSWPVPVAVGQKVSLSGSYDFDSVTIDGRSLMVMNPKQGLGSNFNIEADVLCLESSLGCHAAPVTYGLEFDVRSPFFHGAVPVGQTVQVGEWMVFNPGVVHTPAHICDEVDDDFYLRERDHREETSGQLLAWTVDPAVLQEDPAWCSVAVRNANGWPQGGPFGYAVPTEGQWRSGTVGFVQNFFGSDWISIEVDGASDYYRWPGSLPTPLSWDEPVEVFALEGQSALKTATHLLWTLATWTEHVDRIPGTPEVRYEPACLLSNAFQASAAVVSWEGESIRLLPGMTADLGPWTVVHHSGTFRSQAGCKPDGSVWHHAVTSAVRSLED